MLKKRAPEVNAGSMADIAFLLLVFFIVATTMEVDSGLLRRLPPFVTDPGKDIIVHDRNVFVVLVNSRNDLMVEGEPCQLTELKEKTIEFLFNSENKLNLPVKKTMDVPLFGLVEVPQGVISLQNDRGTEYGAYLKVQNELLAAAIEVRNSISEKKFGKAYEELSNDQQDAVRKRLPIMISEAEPKNIQ